MTDAAFKMPPFIPKVATRVFACACCTTAWILAPMLVVGIRESEGGCINDNTLFAGELLQTSPAFMDALLAASRPLNNAMRSSSGFFIFYTFLCMAWTTAANVYVWHAAVTNLRRSLKELLRVYLGAMFLEVATHLLFWLPPASGFIQPGTVYYYYPLGLTVACSGQLFSGRFVWVSCATFDFWLTHKRSPNHRAYTVASVLCLILGLCYLLGTRQVFGMGALTSATATGCLCWYMFRVYLAKRSLQRSAVASASASALGMSGPELSSARVNPHDLSFSDTDSDTSDKNGGTATSATHAHKRVGPVVRIADNDLPSSLNDPDDDDGGGDEHRHNHHEPSVALVALDQRQRDEPPSEHEAIVVHSANFDNNNNNHQDAPSLQIHSLDDADPTAGN